MLSNYTFEFVCKKGTKPSWSRAAKPDLAKKLYNQFINICKEKIGDNIQTGIFGANMQVESINDGPVTLILDTKNKE